MVERLTDMVPISANDAAVEKRVRVVGAKIG
jgi:hypothetical protein